MLSKKEMTAQLISLGLRRRYKPYWVGEPGDGSIGLEVRKFLIKDGSMHGSMFDIYSSFVLVWTSQKKKAIAAARTNGFVIKVLDREAELKIPFDRADEFLHSFGAKVKATRTLTPEQRAAGAVRLAAVRASRKTQTIGH